MVLCVGWQAHADVQKAESEMVGLRTSIATKDDELDNMVSIGQSLPTESLQMEYGDDGMMMIVIVSLISCGLAFVTCVCLTLTPPSPL